MTCVCVAKAEEVTRTYSRTFQEVMSTMMLERNQKTILMKQDFRASHNIDETALTECRKSSTNLIASFETKDVNHRHDKT